MNRSYFLGVVLVALASFQTLNLQAGKEETWNSPVFITIPNDGTYDGSRDLHVSLQILTDQRIEAIEILNPKENPAQDMKISQFKDGKVDVDIIIRGGNVRPFIRPYSYNPTVRIQLLTVHYITVDNISGVFQANTNPTTDVEPRISHAVISDGGLTGNTVDANIELTSPVLENRMDISNTTNSSTVSSDLTLYPNPVRDGNLFIRIPESMGTVSQITVMNALGGLVQQYRPEATYGSPVQLSLEGISAGVYFVRIHTSTGDIVKKFNVSR